MVSIKARIIKHLPQRAIFPVLLKGAPNSQLSEASQTTFRVRCLPSDCTSENTASLLEAALGLHEGSSDISVRSLAYSAGYDGEKTATISSIFLSEKLQGQESQWTFELPGRTNITSGQGPHASSIIIDSHFKGLTPLNSFEKWEEHVLEYFDDSAAPSERTDFSSCIAIPGLGGHAFSSFKENGGSHMWLRDTLPHDLRGVRVWVYGYDTKLMDSESFQDLEALASTFRRSLVFSRRPTSAVHPTLPLIFVAHSLGGIVLKEALIQMSLDQGSETMATFKAVFGMLFFGCPSQGMDIGSLIPICNGQANLPFLFSLAHSSERLRQQCRDFPKRFSFPDSRIILFYETKLSPTALKTPDNTWEMAGPLAILVSETSATHSRPGEDQPYHIQAINKNHSDMVKFAHKDLEYDVVLGFLQEFAACAPAIIQARFEHNERTKPKGLPRVLPLESPSTLTGKPDRHEQTSHFQYQQIYGNVVRWLAPQEHENDHYKEDLEDARCLRHSDTCQWILTKPDYETWSNSRFTSEFSLLWICAIPGAGKTVLASYLIDQAVQKSSDNPPNVLYFFFKNTDKDKNTPLAAAKALIHQLLQSDIQMELLGELQSCMETSSHPRAFNFKSLWSLFYKYCSRVPKHSIILDALDECENVKILLPGLFELSQKHSIKVVFTSRREQNLISELNGLPVVNISPEDVADDIKAYINHQVSEQPTLCDRRVRPRIIRILNARSKGMFLWVALMIKELVSLSSIHEIDEALSSIPEDLEGVYERILKRLHSNLKPSKRLLCTRLLRWIVLAKRPLHLEELKEALRLDYAMTPDGFCFVQNFLCSQRELESICGSLVTSKNQIIQLIHFSTKEFLLRPDHSLNLDEPLKDFLVSSFNDSAYVADRLLFCMADFWKSTGVLYQKHRDNEEFDNENSDDEDTGVLLDRFLEYAFFNWASHIIESRPQNIRSYAESMKNFFYSYQSWWNWIECCLKAQPDSFSQLRIQVQSLLDWSNAYAEDDPMSLSPEPFESILNKWAESILRVLEDYGLALQWNPATVHRIDPAAVRVPAIHQPVASRLQDSETYERHVILGSRQASLASLRLAMNRQLPRNTSPRDEYGLFHFDRRQSVIFFADEHSARSHKIECQEVSTGRRALPVIDSELQDDAWANARVAGAAMSPDSRYLGLVYEKVLHNMHDRATQITFYIVVWLLQNTVNFSGEPSTPWARKVVSLTATTDFWFRSRCPITFTADNILCCPCGYVNLITGYEESLPRQFSLEDPEESLGNFTFSGYGGDVFCMRLRDEYPGSINHISRNGNIREVVGIACSLHPKLLRVSQSGRFVIWRQQCEQMSYDIKYCIHDTLSNRTSDLEAPQFQNVPTEEFVFTKDDKGLLGIIQEDEMADTHMIFWSLERATYDIRGTKTLKGGFLGCCVDDVEKMVYIVNKQRIWNCYNLETHDLCNSHVDLDEKPLHRIVHKVSRDGERLALLCLKASRVRIQVFDLNHTDDALVNRTLDLPNRDYENALAIFSPNLELLFIGNMILSTRAADLKPLPVPTHFLYQDTMNGLDRRDSWSGSFSACSEYLVLFLDPVDRTKQPAELHVFHIGALRDSLDELTFPNLDITPYERLDVSFHPHGTHVLLLSGQKAISRREWETNCQLLNVKTGAVERLGSQSHPRRFNSHAVFSTCGTYVIKAPPSDSTLELLFWITPISHSLREPQPLPTASSLSNFLNAKGSESDPLPVFNTITTERPCFWTNFRFRLSVKSPKLIFELGSLNSDHDETITLTVIPKRLERAKITAIVGDDWSSRKARVLFVSNDCDDESGRIAEMRMLDFKLQDALYRYSRSAKIKGMRDAKVEDRRVSEVL